MEHFGPLLRDPAGNSSVASFFLPHIQYSPSTIPKPILHEDEIGGLGAINSFTKKLYHMVTTEDPDIISFTPGESALW